MISAQFSILLTVQFTKNVSTSDLPLNFLAVLQLNQQVDISLLMDFLNLVSALLVCSKRYQLKDPISVLPTG